mgnify:FL=1
MAKDGELILDKRKPYIRYTKLDLFDVMPAPEGKMKTSGLKKTKGDISAKHLREMNEETKKELTDQLHSILNDLKQATDNS